MTDEEEEEMTDEDFELAIVFGKMFMDDSNKHNL